MKISFSLEKGGTHERGRADSPGVGSLREYSLEVEWQDLRSGQKALQKEIVKFLCGKLRLGIRNFPQTFQEEFIGKVQRKIKS